MTSRHTFIVAILLCTKNCHYDNIMLMNVCVCVCVCVCGKSGMAKTKSTSAGFKVTLNISESRLLTTVSDILYLSYH